MKQMMLRFISFFLILFLSGIPAQAETEDMISPKSDGGRCLTVDSDDPATAPGIVLDACRGTDNQMWIYDTGASQWKTKLNQDYCLATVGSSLYAGASLTVRPCTDSRALTLEPNPEVDDSYRLAVTGATTYVLDWGVYGKVALASQNGWSYQLFSWLQPDVDLITEAGGCNLTYPLDLADTDGYELELACDHVAKIQPPYDTPTLAQRDPAVWPGTVPEDAALVTRSFAFNLQFKDNGYMRTDVRTQNWFSTGLYAPAGQTVHVTVSDAEDADLDDVYVQIGVHTDILKPTSGNVISAEEFKRYPNVVVKVRLDPGENLVRNPYGGVIELISEESVDKTINVTIADAVEAPYFVLDQTTEAQWLALRDAPGAWAVIESDLAVTFEAAEDVRTLSFAEITGVAQYYRDVLESENDLMGLSDSDTDPVHLLPDGQQRFVNDIQITAGAAHSGYPMMFGNFSMADPDVLYLRSSDTTWGICHELGHNNQMGSWKSVYGIESTNNMFSVYFQETFFGMSRLIVDDRYAKAISVLNDSEVTDKWSEAGIWGKIVFMDQIRLGFPDVGWDYLSQVMRSYREMTDSEYSALNTEQLKFDKFMELACDATDTDLTPHFDAYGVPVSQDAKDYCASKGALTQDIWLIDNAQPMSYHPGSGAGGFYREYWLNIDTVYLAALTDDPDFPNNPDGSEILYTGLEGPVDWEERYGQRLRAYIHPPVTGKYRFWLSADNTAQLWLSTDEAPSNAVKVLELTEASGCRKFDAFDLSVQRSAEIELEADQKYYIEVLHKEGGYNDSVSVAWNIPATAQWPGEVRKIIAAQYLSPFVDPDHDDVPDDQDQCPGHDDRIDSDQDGTPDGCDLCPNDPEKTDPGTCGCGVPDGQLGDVNNDCVIDRADVNYILEHNRADLSECPQCDIDGDGSISLRDARKVLLMY